MPMNREPHELPAASPENSAIEKLAHALWEERGCPIGSPEEDWFRAERELCERQVKVVSASIGGEATLRLQAQAR
jgi:hypothetical protein